MLIDAHCHAWPVWPYQPPVPDPNTRAAVEQLIWEMDQHGVERAVVVCARIDHNPDNNDYVADAVRRYPDRLYQFADVDCRWTSTYQQPGAAARLEAAVRQYGLRGFTHYIDPDDRGAWYLSEAGSAFFRAAAELNQIVSVALPVRLQPVLRELARRFPSVPFMCHHMAGARVAVPPGQPPLDEILASAALPNIHLKLSGLHYVAPREWDFPFPECRPIVQALYEHFGPERLHWGSDYPVVRRALTYRQALEAVRAHCEFISVADLKRILGESLRDLLTAHGLSA